MVLGLVLPDLRTGVVAFVAQVSETGLPLPTSLMLPGSPVVAQLRGMRNSLHSVAEYAPAGS